MRLQSPASLPNAAPSTAWRAERLHGAEMHRAIWHDNDMNAAGLYLEGQSLDPVVAILSLGRVVGDAARCMIEEKASRGSEQDA